MHCLHCLRFFGSLNILRVNVIARNAFPCQRLTIMQRSSHRRTREQMPRVTRSHLVNVIIIHDVDKEPFRARRFYATWKKSTRDSLGCLRETRLVSDHRLAYAGLSLVDRIGVIDRFVNRRGSSLSTSATCLCETTCPILFSYL